MHVKDLEETNQSINSYFLGGGIIILIFFFKHFSIKFYKCNEFILPKGH